MSKNPLTKSDLTAFLETLDKRLSAIEETGKRLQAIFDNASVGSITASEFVSISTAAELLEVSEDSVQRWIKSGDLQAYRAPGGRLIRLKTADLHHCMKALPNPKARKAI